MRGLLHHALKALHEAKPRTRDRYTRKSFSVASTLPLLSTGKSSRKCQKLAVDFTTGRWLVSVSEGGPMDVEDLIERLCVTAGAIMEDASVSAISAGDGQHERVVALLQASEMIGALARAAEVLERLFQDSA